MSIRFRLALWYAAALAALLILFGVAVRAAMEEQLQRDIDASLVPPAQEVAAALQIRGAGVERSVYLPAVQTFKAPGVYVQLDGLGGHILARSATLQDNSLPPPSRQVRSGTLAVVQLEGASVRLYTLPLRWQGRVIGYVQVGKSLHDERRALGTLTDLLLLAGGAAILLSFGVAWLVARSALRPLAAMTTAARGIAGSPRFGERLPGPESRDELSLLAGAFNEVLASLDGMHSLQQRFLADASHELRTPLSVLQANLDFLAMAPDAPAAEREEALHAARRAAGRMGRLVHHLLSLARLEVERHVRVPSGRQPVELDAVVASAYEEIKPLARRVRTSLLSLDRAVLDGDADRLCEVILILLDNALKYTPRGGAVSVSLEARDGWASVSVRDTGIGIPTEEIPRIFGRFYRSPRASQQHRDGSGLGLAIAQQIVQAHGGRISVASAPGEGSVFTVHLPLDDRT